MTEQEQTQREPIVTIYPDQSLQVGAGYTIGDILRALDMARAAVLGITPNPGQPPQQVKA